MSDCDVSVQWVLFAIKSSSFVHLKKPASEYVVFQFKFDVLFETCSQPFLPINHSGPFTFQAINTIFSSYFHLCFELPLETCKIFFELFSEGSLVNFQWSVRALRSANAPPDWKLGTISGAPTRVSMPMCASWMRNGLAVLQPVKAAAMCMACYEFAHPLPPILSPLLVQKPIFKTECANW